MQSPRIGGETATGTTADGMTTTATGGMIMIATGGGVAVGRAVGRGIEIATGAGRPPLCGGTEAATATVAGRHHPTRDAGRRHHGAGRHRRDGMRGAAAAVAAAPRRHRDAMTGMCRVHVAGIGRRMRRGGMQQEQVSTVTIGVIETPIGEVQRTITPGHVQDTRTRLVMLRVCQPFRKDLQYRWSRPLQVEFALYRQRCGSLPHRKLCLNLGSTSASCCCMREPRHAFAAMRGWQRLLLLLVAATAAAAVPDHYRELGVPERASLQQIRKAYKTLAKKWHPDVNAAPGATDKFMRIQQAHEVLSDDTKRREYDFERQHGYSRQDAQRQQPHGFHPGQHSGGGEFYMFQGPDGRLYRVRQQGGGYHGGGFQHPFGGGRWGNQRAQYEGDWLWWMASVLEDPAIVLYGTLLLLFLVMLAARNAGPQQQQQGAAAPPPPPQQQQEDAPVYDPVQLPNLSAWSRIRQSLPLVSTSWLAAHESRMLLLIVLDESSDPAAVDALLHAAAALAEAVRSDPLAVAVCACDAAAPQGQEQQYQRALARRLHRVSAVDVFDADDLESSPFVALLRVRVSTGTARATRVLLPSLAYRDADTCTTALQHVCETALGGRLPFHNVTDLLQAVLPQPVEAAPPVSQAQSTEQ